MAATPSNAADAGAGPDGDGTPREHDFHDLSPPDRFCDLVLTGGVTSAIAYPGLIFGLAQSYRFHGLGGSSSGAGTAALAAAAEYRRRRGSAEGFRTMLRGSMAMRDDAVPPPQGAASSAARAQAAPAPSRTTKLAWLFQPDAELERLFDTVAPGIAAQSGSLFFQGVMRAYGRSLLLNAAAAWVMACGVLGVCGALGVGSVFVALVLALVGALVRSIVFEFGSDLRRFESRDFGLCTGQQALPGAPHPPLTPWLHGLIQQVAGRSTDDAPLTFADLQDVRGGPGDMLGRSRSAQSSSIDLRIYTANVTQGRPVVFPQAERNADALAADAPDNDTLYFKPAELRELFPKTVVDHMVRQSVPAARQAGGPAESLLWLLPRRQLPVIVAARMSVAFPVLFRAVPLWTRQPAGDKRAPDAFTRCLFADGSLCSNFPVHLFDSLLPSWPTFGLSLEERADVPDHFHLLAEPDNMVFLPEAMVSVGQDLPRNRHWGPRAAHTSLMSYLCTMLSTVMHWHDASLARLPGFSERVVQVGLPKGIGGLNIFMNRDQIDYLAKLGGAAARALLKRYTVPNQPGGVARGWREHRWLRLSLLCDSLRAGLSGLGGSAEHARYAMPISRQIDDATHEAPLAHEANSSLLAGDAAALQATLSALLQTEAALGRAPTDLTLDLDPRPVLRVQPSD